MPDSTIVLTAIRNELEALGIIRRPSSAGDLPPMFVEPIDGPPAPGEREGTEAGGNLTVTLRLSSEAPARAGEAYRRLIVVDVIYRSTGTAGLKAGRALDAAVRGALVETSGYGLGRLLDASGARPVLALEISLFGGLGPVSQDAGVRTELAKYALDVHAA